jgi:hypothetical protein
MIPLRGDLNAATGGDEGIQCVSLYRRADGTSRLVVRSEFTTPYGKLLRGTSLPHGMENSPTHCAPVEKASPSQGRINNKEKISNFHVKLNCIE